MQADGLKARRHGDEEGAVLFPLPRELVARAEKHLGGDLILGLRPESIVKEGEQRGGRPDLRLRTQDRLWSSPRARTRLIISPWAASRRSPRVHPEDKAPVGSMYRFRVDFGAGETL